MCCAAKCHWLGQGRPSSTNSSDMTCGTEAGSWRSSPELPVYGRYMAVAESSSTRWFALTFVTPEPGRFGWISKSYCKRPGQSCSAQAHTKQTTYPAFLRRRELV